MTLQGTSTGRWISCGLLLLLVWSGHGVQAQDTTQFDIKERSFLLPLQRAPWKYSHAIYLQYVVPPKDWTLDAVVAPMFNYTGKYTLPKGFNVQAGVSSLIISNRFNLGPFWNYSKGNWHMGIGYQVAFNFGVLRHFGFNTILTGWETQPSLTLGYSFEKTAVTIRGDLYNTLDISLSEGGNTLSNAERFVNGYSILTSFEQRLTRQRVMSLGFRMNYLRYHIIAWPALPASKYSYFMPEFVIGLNF